MSRCIYADVLKEDIAKQLEACKLIFGDSIFEILEDSMDGVYKTIDRQPTVDAVEVVRCKYCKHFHDGIYNGEYWMECNKYKIALSSDEWFCADGKRREE